MNLSETRVEIREDCKHTYRFLLLSTYMTYTREILLQIWVHLAPFCPIRYIHMIRSSDWVYISEKFWHGHKRHIVDVNCLSIQTYSHWCWCKILSMLVNKNTIKCLSIKFLPKNIIKCLSIKSKDMTIKNSQRNKRKTTNN